ESLTEAIPIPVSGASQTFVKRYFGTPAEHLCGASRIDATPPLLAGLGRPMLRAGCAAQRVTQLAKNFEHVSFETGADIDLSDKFRTQRGDIGVHHVIDID